MLTAICLCSCRVRPPNNPLLPQWPSKIGRKVWDDKVNLLRSVSCVWSLFWWRIFHATCSLQ